MAPKIIIPKNELFHKFSLHCTASLYRFISFSLAGNMIWIKLTQLCQCQLHNCSFICADCCSFTTSFKYKIGVLPLFLENGNNAKYLTVESFTDN